MLGTIIILICIGIVCYVLYLQGFLTTNCKIALMYMGSIRGNDSCKASFKSCSGYMKRVIRFRESKSYRFVLNAELEKGELEVKILNSSKEPVMILNGTHPSAMVEMDKNRRYYLIFSFKSASGNYEFRWE